MVFNVLLKLKQSVLTLFVGVFIHIFVSFPQLQSMEERVSRLKAENKALQEMIKASKTLIDSKEK